MSLRIHRNFAIRNETGIHWFSVGLSRKMPNGEFRVYGIPMRNTDGMEIDLDRQYQ